MIDSCCHRHDGRDVLVAAEGGQSTPGQPDRDTEGIIGADPATDTLEVGDLQSVKHVESNPQRKLPSCATELSGLRGRYGLGGGCGLVKQRVRGSIRR